MMSFSLLPVNTARSYCGSFSAWLTVQNSGLSVTRTPGDPGVTRDPGTHPEALVYAGSLPVLPMSSNFRKDL